MNKLMITRLAAALLTLGAALGAHAAEAEGKAAAKSRIESMTPEQKAAAKAKWDAMTPEEQAAAKKRFAEKHPKAAERMAEKAASGAK